MKYVRSPFAAAILLLAACSAAPVSADNPGQASSTGQPQTAATVPLTVTTASGQRRFNVEVARTAQEQARGLMYRTALPTDGGMIFPFAPPRPASFWMKNTVIPLDMLFIRADGTIARIAENTTPNSLDLVESGEPVAAVLEIAGGGAAAAGIAEGDRVSWNAG